MTAATWLQADRGALPEWLALHSLARRLPADDAARQLAEAALHHVLPFTAELPDDVPFVGAHAPTQPRAHALEPWLTQVEQAAGTPESGKLVAAGVELGLLGIDEGSDRRAAAVLVEGFELDTVQSALEEIGRQALLDPFVGIVAELLADTVAEDLGRRPLLRALCRGNEHALLALKDRATAHPSLAVMSVYLWVVVDRYPDRRAASARTLLMLDPHAVGDIRALWGEDGPVTREQHAELLNVFGEANCHPPELDLQRATAHLLADPLDDADAGDPVALALRELPDHLELPGYCAWYAAAHRPGPTHPLDTWGRIAAVALTPSADVPEARADELLAIVADELIEPKTLDGYFEAIERLSAAAGDTRFDHALAHALTTRLEQSEDPVELLAVTFSIWAKAPGGGQDLHDRVLAPAAKAYRHEDDEIRVHLGPRRQAEWDEWVARHPLPRFGRRRFGRRRSRAR